jgi:hypothetical protein
MTLLNIARHIKSNNSGTAKVKIIKNDRDPPLFTGKMLIKFQNILRNITQVIIRHRVKILFSRQILCRTITLVVFLRILKFYQLFTGEERIPFFFDDMTENRIVTLCPTIYLILTFYLKVLAHYRHELVFFWRFSSPSAHYATLNTVNMQP